MDTSVPVPPLLVAEGFDLMLYRSEAALSGDIEPWYVEVEHRAWDALGRQVELVVVDPPAHAGGKLARLLRQEPPRIGVRLAEDAASGAQECASYLREWLSEVHGPEMPANASLSDLIVQVLTRADVR